MNSGECMLIYNYKGKKSLISNDDGNNNRNLLALYKYNKTLFKLTSNYQKLLDDVYYSYTTLCDLNNLLVKDEYGKAISLLQSFITNHEPVKNSEDINCVNIYRSITKWLRELENERISNDIVKNSVVKIMQIYEKEGIYKISGCNLKSNYYDFC